jgi:hypothetical protein
MTIYAEYERFYPDAEETRHLMVFNDPELPEDKYALNESYCADPDCDCRRVQLQIVSAKKRERLATIAYAFSDDPDETPDGLNPYIEPAVRQGRYAEPLLDLVTELIETDADYAERLERHYREVKQFMRDHPDDGLHAAVKRDRTIMKAYAEEMVAEVFESSPAAPRRDRAKERRKRKASRRSRKKNRR